MTELTLGFSSCPNDTFIFDAMVNGKIDCEGLKFRVIMEDVEALNERALNGDLDITKLSYHAFALVSQAYILMHSGSALGKGCGPLLIAKDELDHKSLQNCSVAVPGKMTTAHFLFNLFYPNIENKKYMRFDQIEAAVSSGAVDAGVIIHENRFTYKEKGLVCINDLGSSWENQTDMPIPLGGIAVRRSLNHNLQMAVQNCIYKSITYAFQHPESSMKYVRQHAQELDAEVIQQHIDLYVNDYSVDLGNKGIEAVEKLFTMAEALGIIEHIKKPYLI